MYDPELLKWGRTLLNLFKLSGKPAGDQMSDGQVVIFLCIVLKINPRVANVGPTGYGKSEAISMGVIYRSCLFREDFVVAAEKNDTADIIMSKVIEHLFDNELFYDELELTPGERLDRLKRSRKKDHINFRKDPDTGVKGGSLRIVSLHGSDEDASAAIGEHVPNIILDESPLLSPAKYLMVLKMLEGTGDYNKTFLFELGNAINRNHFMINVTTNPNYLKIYITIEQAIKEGRLDQKSVDEKRGLPFFEQFYLVQFPKEEEMDEKGYRILLTHEEVHEAQERYKRLNFEEIRISFRKLGMDIAGGGDDNAYVERTNIYGRLVGKNKSKDTMVNVAEAERLTRELGIPWEELFIDDIGIGRGPSDRMKELDHDVNAVSVGDKAEDSSFMNLRAELWWKVRIWIKAGGCLDPNIDWEQLTWIKYKINSDKQLKIMPKEEIKKQHGGKSPDTGEALMLTFAEPENYIDVAGRD